MIPDNIILSIRALKKRYFGIEALKGIDLDIERNKIQCIVGENGAGKSTLIKIIAGVENKDEGKILLNADDYDIHSIRESRLKGISVIFQELNVVEQLTVEHNLFLGIEKRRFGIIQKERTTSREIETLRDLDGSINLNRKMAELSTAQKQIVEIAKAVSQDAKILIMDEPTASLSLSEIKKLFKIIADLKKRNITIIYISHKLEEVFEVGDSVLVLRDGQAIGNRTISNLNSAELVQMMTGRIVADKYTKGEIDYSKAKLEARHATTDKLKDVNFTLFKGEILGFFGLLGSGKTEIARVVSGIDSLVSGQIFLDGILLEAQTIRSSISRGIVYIPEERRSQGLIGLRTIRENINLMNYRKASSFGLVNRIIENKISIDNIKRFSIAAKSAEQNVFSLSGGNQQKVVLAKCLNSDAHLLLFDEPTRGIDVGAKEEVHNIIKKLAKSSKLVIVFSSELQELINLCDRIIVLFEGRIVYEAKNDASLSAEAIMNAALGVQKNGAN